MYSKKSAEGKYRVFFAAEGMGVKRGCRLKRNSDRCEFDCSNDHKEVLRCCLERSGQWLENVDQTHLVLASGKLALQKRNLSAGGQ